VIVARSLGVAAGVEESARPGRIQGAALGWLAGPAAAAALLGIARALPASGVGLWLRLAAATLIVLLPGYLVARALGRRSAAATLAWSLALFGCGLAIAFALGASLDVALVFDLVAGAAALTALVTGSHLEGLLLPRRTRLVRGLLVVAGLSVGVALWSIQGVLAGDGFFHLGRIRKLDALGSLSLHDVGEFVRGGLHPGYAFPLWHGWLALVARVAGVDPTAVARHESSLLVPLALVLAYEMGWAIFRSAGLAFAVMLAQVALKALAPGHAGVYSLLWEPGTAATQLLLPASVALFFCFLREPIWPAALTLAAVSASLALVHPTYALFVAIPLAAYVVVRALLTRGAELRTGVAALVTLGAPTGLAYLWLRPIVEQTVALHLGPAGLMHSLHHYRSDLVVSSIARYSLSPQRIDRAGSVAVAALLLTPLALLARRRRWSALVLGATVVVLTLELWPVVFPHFANFVSLSQARRATGFIPFAVAFAGGAAILARLSRPLALALAVGCGIWLQLAYGGNFGLHAPRTMPAFVAWTALYGCAAAIVVGTALAWIRRDPGARHAGSRGLTAALAATLFVLPVAISGFSNWSPRKAQDPNALTPGLVSFLQHGIPARSVVFGDLETSYRATAFAPVYVVAVPPSHVANTKPNRVHDRRRAVLKFFAHPNLAIPVRWHAGWLVLKRNGPIRYVERQGLRPVYADARFLVFRLPAGA
jgi:hypothetical protein